MKNWSIETFNIVLHFIGLTVESKQICCFKQLLIRSTTILKRLISKRYLVSVQGRLLLLSNSLIKVIQWCINEHSCKRWNFSNTQNNNKSENWRLKRRRVIVLTLDVGIFTTYNYYTHIPTEILVRVQNVPLLLTSFVW